MQCYTVYLFLWDALHVSRGFSAHHQELKTLYRTSDTLSKLYCYLPRQGLAKYPMLYMQVWAPDVGRRNRLKLVEHFTEINKLCKIASCWLYLRGKTPNCLFPDHFTKLHHFFSAYLYKKDEQTLPGELRSSKIARCLPIMITNVGPLSTKPCYPFPLSHFSPSKMFKFFT